MTATYHTFELRLRPTAKTDHGCQVRVKSVALAVCQPLPVFLDKLTFSASADMSQMWRPGFRRALFHDWVTRCCNAPSLMLPRARCHALEGDLGVGRQSFLPCS